MKESERTEEIITFPLYPYLLQGQQALPNCKPISAGCPGDKSYRTPPHPTTPKTGVYTKVVLTSTHNLCFEKQYEKISKFLFENFHFLVVKFSVNLNRHVFHYVFVIYAPKQSRG